ncbi:MAG: GatB/YqeY domain-containing protein [Bryobacteraceae bacterium]|nr:GatB/YqeY domain-containing protein [Bryobacteraceae bacterium]
MPLLDQLQKDMVAAMKAKEELKLSAIRMVKTALMKEKVDSMKDLDETTELKVLNMLLKQRRESVEMFRKGGREEQAAKEEAEIRIIEAYMPAMATEEEVEAAIQAALRETGATTAKQMGLVMKAAQAQLAGKRVDGRTLSEKVKAKLG